MAKTKLTVEDMVKGKKEILGFDCMDPMQAGEMIVGNGRAIRYVSKSIITRGMIISAISQNPYAIQDVDVDFIDEDLLLMAICREPNLLDYAGDIGMQTEEMCIEAIRRDWKTIDYATVFTKDICMEAVKRDGSAISHIPLGFIMDEQIARLAVNNNPGYALKYVKQLDLGMCIDAVRKCPEALQYIREQNEAICMAAVSVDGCALQYVKKKTSEICAAALFQSNDAIQYIPNSMFEEVVDIMNTKYTNEEDK